MAKRKKDPETSPLPPVVTAAEGAIAPGEAPNATTLTPTNPKASAQMSHDPKASDERGPDDIPRFWSGAGLIFGVWVIAGFFSFMLLVLLSRAPTKPLPPLDRPHIEETLGDILRELRPAAERYTKIAIEVQAMLDAERLTDEALRKELNEALSFAKQVSTPREYWLTPIWLEGAPSALKQAIPVLRVEALNDATTPGSRAELPQSQPAWQKVSFGAVKSVSALWAAGDPLRLRFSLRDAEGLQPTITIGGDDVELAPDAPLPGAAMLLLGEPRALTRGQGRYLVRVRTKEGGVLVPPLLLLRALDAPD